MSDKSRKYDKPEKTGMKGATRAKATLKYTLLAVILILTFWCYHYSLHNEFTNWDDDRFLMDNIYIRSFSAENLKMIFFHDVNVDNYMPVTLISYALNYHFSVFTPQSYYLTNIIIHLLNCCLLYFLVLQLFRAMEKNGYGAFAGKEWLAFFCTLLFAIHPMHVESVSWIAERKDVLYAFFYFAGMLAYIRFTATKTKKYRWLVLVFSCFLLSVFSKPMAIVFPFSLLAIDVLLKRDKTITWRNMILEKTPFILVSIILTVLTYNIQKTSGALIAQSNYNFFQRFLFACYNFNIYVLKAFIPIPQSPFYPFPELLVPSGNLPLVFYLSPFITLLIIALPLYLAYRLSLRNTVKEEKGENNNFRVLLYGISFYFFNMMLISQIINVGPTLTADRYSYVCYLGIFFPATYFVYGIVHRSEWIKKITIGLASVYILLLGFRCYERTLVWHTSETLWTDVIHQYPHKINIAYHHLGHYYFHHDDLINAYYNYWEAINLKIYDARAYRVMGVIMCSRKQYDSALYCYKVAVAEDSNLTETYLDRGLCYSIIGNYTLAIKDYKRYARVIAPTDVVLGDIAFSYLNSKQFDSAVTYYSRAIQMNPSNPNYFHYRGAAEFDMGALKPAMDDFIQNIRMAPHDSECMFFLALAYTRLKDFNSAYHYAQMAQNAQYAVPDEYMAEIKKGLAKKM